MTQAHPTAVTKFWLAAASIALAVLALALMPPDAPAQTDAADAYDGLPTTFAPNSGQTDEHVRYLAQGPGHAFFFTDDKAVLSFVAPGDGEADGGLALDVRFVGANPAAVATASERAAGTVNQLTGAKSEWRADVPTYEELTYRELWPGIDMVVRGTGGELAYEFHLAPGADPSDIRLAYAGADAVSLESPGQAVIHTALGELEQQSGHPLVADGNGHLGFATGPNHDSSRGHVLDTELVYSSFAGGSGSDSGRGVAVDQDGSAYVTGQSASADFPTTPGAHDRSIQNTDVFVTKLDRPGSTIVYSTFVGGFAFDSGNGIAVDEAGSAYIAGFTGSTNFPTTVAAFDPTHNGFTDAFVTKLDPSGSELDYSSYLGAGGFASDGANGIAVDDRGAAYVTGFAGSNAFPTTPGAYDQSHNGRNDVYVTKVKPSGSALAYSTFIGGSLLDTGNAIAVDRDRTAYVTGITASADLPTTAGAPDRSHNGGGNDAFVAKVDASGSALAYSTFLGGAGDDNGRGISVDMKGKSAHVAGSTSSSDYPTTDEAFDRSYNGGGDAFVTRFDRDGSDLAYSTFLGGNAADSATAIAVGEKGKAAHVTGSTSSSDYPTTRGAFDRTYNGGGDAVVTVFNRSGEVLRYSTFLGGIGQDAGLAIAVDEKAKTAYVTGSTTSGDYPVTDDAPDPSYNGAGDGVVTKLSVRRGG